MHKQNALWRFHYYADRTSQTFLGMPFHVIEKNLFGRITYERLKFLEKQGYFPHLHKPRTYSEKLCHRKLFVENPLFSKVADKWEVREYVAEKVGRHILNEVFAVTTDPACIPYDTLPRRFVIKATHGSARNIFVMERANANIPSIIERTGGFLQEQYGLSSNETHYLQIEPRLMVEAYLLDASHNIPEDYKFYVFHGKCQFIHVDFDRFGHHTRRFFTRDWQPLDFVNLYPLGPCVDPPANLGEMLEVAEALGADFEFIRVDLYSIDDKRVVFGELTVTPGAGWLPLGPTRDVDFLWGSYW